METFNESLGFKVVRASIVFLVALTLFGVLLRSANAMEVKQCCKKVGFNGDLECRTVEKFAFCAFDEIVVD